LRRIFRLVNGVVKNKAIAKTNNAPIILGNRG
jgi:hypothetical protein